MSTFYESCRSGEPTPTLSDSQTSPRPGSEPTVRRGSGTPGKGISRTEVSEIMVWPSLKGKEVGEGWCKGFGNQYPSLLTEDVRRWLTELGPSHLVFTRGWDLVWLILDVELRFWRRKNDPNSFFEEGRSVKKWGLRWSQWSKKRKKKISI